MVAKIGPLTTLAVGNTGAKPGFCVEPEELEEETPFLAETTMPGAVNTEDARDILLLEAEETEDPIEAEEPRPELKAGREEEGYPPPFIVKFAQVMIVLLT